MICVSRSSTILPISGEYDDFVRRGSGVIEREFGPFDYESFRADVSGPVGTGQSWQLAFFLAHAIDAAEEVELVDDLDKADRVVWASGRVDYDLRAGNRGAVRVANECDHELERPHGLSAGVPDVDLTLVERAKVELRRGELEVRRRQRLRRTRAGRDDRQQRGSS